MESKWYMNIVSEKCYLILFILILTIGLSACSQNTNLESYDGKSLKIAVIGELPIVKERQATFKEITFTEIINDEFHSYDAVLIMEDHLSKASESKYSDYYLHSNTPFFFIAANSHVPFTVKDTACDEIWDWSPGHNYAVGIVASQEVDI